MRTLELYFNDLTPEAQEKYLKVQGVSDPSELNWEINPVAIIEIEDEEDSNDPTIPGSFVSVWDSGNVQTEGILNLRTGEVICKTPLELESLGSLDREYFTDRTGKEYEICPECHQFILKTVMEPDKTGKGTHEEQVCAGLCDPE